MTKLIVALAILAFTAAAIIAAPLFASGNDPDHPFRVSWSHTSHTERLSHSRHTYSRRGDA